MSTQTSVVNLLNIPEAIDGVAPGFDLDEYASDQNDGRSCYKPDLTDPDGTTGVDNQLATLVPLFNLEGEGAVASLVQQAINEGRLLIIFEMSEMDDGTHQLLMRRAEDIPLLGTNGTLLTDQTFTLRNSPPIAVIKDIQLNGREFEIGPVDVSIPVVVFNLLYDMHMPEGRLRLTTDEDGRIVSGKMGGGVSSESIEGMLNQASQRLPDFVSLIRSGVEDAKDMGIQPSGECSQLSMGVTFEAVPAFTYE